MARMLPTTAAIALVGVLLLVGCEDQTVVVQLERQTLASLCTTDCPTAEEAAQRGCARARSLGMSLDACSVTERCAGGSTLVSVGRTAGTDEPGEQWWFDGDGHLIASRHCRPDEDVEVCVHYGPDLRCGEPR